MKTNTISALAPTPEPLDPDWSQATLAGILADQTPVRRRRSPRRLAALVGAAIVVVSTGTALALGSPTNVVRGVIEDFSHQPNTTGNGLGKLDDPVLVASFETPNGLFSFWVAGSSSGTVCYASSDGAWNGEGVPTKDQLEYGCGGEVATDSDHAVALTSPEQLGGFFKDSDGPLLYGISTFANAVEVRVQGDGIDRTLPLRSDSHGYGAAVPEAAGADSLTLTFLDAAGKVVGTDDVPAISG